ncbi:metallophosphoesterase [Fibrisoma montanum]|uniref:Metallophosphoesterase n=1 Tax=Fibrisoma montanum TaxID=2305895 RepID=A0A418M5U2_9BACT|nr:metallophosphoesterase family protein [Fibrisoma montanum]RIV21146.1 metallophosphoesterase [Fibrisoma montanum]
MKIALFSDIHANLPALDAVLADIDRQQPDAVYCLGDLVGYNVWPNEVINTIRRRGIPTIAGNYDYGIGRASDDCGCAYREEDEKAMGKVSIAYTNGAVGETERAYLRTLPTHIRVEFELGYDPDKLWQQQKPLSLLLVHGSPRRVNEYLFEDRGDRSLGRVLEGANADILCFGHTHKPFHKVVSAEPDDQQTYFRHAINIGSVGKPKDGDPRACYVLLTISETARPGGTSGISVEHIRVDYDIERAAKGVEQSELPDPYADMLRRGR